MLQCQNISVEFSGFVALNDVSLELEAGQRLSIVGPSGCGKTTLLRTVAGLVPDARGTVSWMGRDLTATPVHERGVGLMFQDHALFPHRNVTANVGFGLRMQDAAPHEIETRVAEMLDLVGLSGRGKSRIDELSGGERQRVALARTLAPSPDLVLLDEPLASLDAVIRTELLDEMTSIFAELSVTAIAVTHDLDEAFRFGERIAVMSPGRIERIGPTGDVWREPGTAYTARFLGYSPVTSHEPRSDGTTATPWGLAEDLTYIPPGDNLAVAPDGFAFDRSGSVEGIVGSASFERGTWRHVVQLNDGSEIVVRSERRHEAAVRMSVDPGAIRFVQSTSSAV